jgi:uncharacterized protein (DUF305 family)
MKNSATLAVALGSSVAGALVAAMVLAFVLPANSHDLPHSAHRHQAEAAAFCSSASKSSRSSFYSEIANVNARMHAGMEVAPSGDVDQDFIQMMIPHHQGAIDMALVLLKHGRDERLRRLAQSIIVEQGQEITYMRTLQNPPSAQPSATLHITGQ